MSQYVPRMHSVLQEREKGIFHEFSDIRKVFFAFVTANSCSILIHCEICTIAYLMNVLLSSQPLFIAYAQATVLPL